MKTNDLEKVLGLSKHTIRYYEKEGFIAPKRDENGYRNYTQEDIQTLQLVKFLRNLNISLDDVKAIMNGQLNFQECLKTQKIYLDKHIEDLKEIKKSLDYYHDKDMPLISSLSQLDINSKHHQLGLQKTTQTISLGRKLTRPWAVRKFLYTLIPSCFAGFFGIFILEFFGLELTGMMKSAAVLICAIIMQLVILASRFQISSVYLADTIDHTMNQSNEFLSDGVRYYIFKGFMNNLKYYFAVLLGKDEKFLKTYRYEDIQEVIIDAKRRYMKFGSPIAYETYVPDFTFVFHDQQRFYFYWPLTLDDDMRYITTILEEKVKNIKDPDNILYALKNGINLHDYCQGK